MTVLSKKHLLKLILVLPAVTGILFSLPQTVPCQTAKPPVARQAEKAVEQALQIQQKSQADQTRWEREKTELVLLYEQLVNQKEALETENADLTARQTAQEKLNQNLLKQKEDAIRIQTELMPFLNRIYDRLESLVANDPPFLKDERANRLATLKTIMKDPEITISEKYRKVMEALFIEAEYGSTIEVYQEKVEVGTENILGNIFRLGRVSLFFLSLDQTTCAVFNVSLDRWQILDADHLPSIRSAVEIGGKRRPVELLPLPLGRLAPQGGAR